MKSHSFLSRHELLATAATVAAHSSAQGNPFRQRDVLFLFELFSNWCQSGIWEDSVKYQNTQLARYLEQLAKDGYARKSKIKSRPAYRLSRSGLIELIFRITNRIAPSPEQFFFTYYFINNYKARLIDLVKAEGTLFPPALKIELFGLLDEKSLLTKEIARVEELQRKMKERIRAAFETAKLTETSLKKGIRMQEIIRLIQVEHPYELNNLKPLSELVGSIPIDQQLWEIGEGAKMRGKQIWEPMLGIIESYTARLQAISAMAI